MGLAKKKQIRIERVQKQRRNRRNVTKGDKKKQKNVFVKEAQGK
jgi:hypothetical protein